MTVDIVDTHSQSPSLLRSYVERSKQLALERCGDLEEYSPLAHSLVLSGIDTVKGYTPAFVQETLVSTVEQLDPLIQCADDLLENVLERTEDFPVLMDRLKQQLTIEQLWEIITELKDNSQQELAKYLPSNKLDDFALKSRVQDIVTCVVSQPQLFKQKASDVAKNLTEQLDIDADGKVSMLDLAGNAYNVSAGVATYCSSLVPIVNFPTQIFENILTNPNSKPIVDAFSAHWAHTQELGTLLQPLWSATELLKEYVSMYATNVKDHFNPLTPYLIALIAETSVIDLPIELYRLTSKSAGFGTDAGSQKVAEETRALFWALIDISFLLEAMKQSDKNLVDPEPIEGVEIIKDADALKDGSWAKGFQSMDFS